MTILIVHTRRLITALITTHEPPSKACQERDQSIGFTFSKHPSPDASAPLLPKPLVFF